MSDPQNEALRGPADHRLRPLQPARLRRAAIYRKLLDRSARRLPHRPARAGGGRHGRRAHAPGGARDAGPRREDAAVRRRGRRRVEARRRSAELQRAAEREGMSGLGPRFVIDVLSRAAIDEQRGEEHARPTSRRHGAASRCAPSSSGSSCPRRRREHSRASSSTRARRSTGCSRTRSARRSSPPSPTARRRILENYLTNCEAYCQKARDCATRSRARRREPDERLLRAVEEQISPRHRERQGHVPPGRADAHRHLDAQGRGR